MNNAIFMFEFGYVDHGGLWLCWIRGVLECDSLFLVCFFFFVLGGPPSVWLTFIIVFFYVLLGSFFRACNIIYKKPYKLILIEIGLCTYLGKPNKYIDQS